MKVLRGIDSVIFDLGNTLVPFTPRDSMEFVVKWYSSSNMEKHGVPFDEFLETYREVVREERYRMFSEKWETTVPWRCERMVDLFTSVIDDPDSTMRDMSSTHSGCFASCIRMNKSSRYVLDMISTYESESGKPVKMGLISNAGDPDALRTFLHKEELEPYFEEIVISGEIGYAKPHGEIFLATLERMETEPARSVYIGDRYEVDFNGSRNVGMNPVYIRQYRTAGEPPEGIGPIEPTITNILDLLPLLECGIDQWS